MHMGVRLQLVCLFVCLSEQPNLSHTNIGLTSMIMNYTNQESVIR